MESQIKLVVRISKSFLLLASAFLIGCASQTHYYWDNYEPTVYSHYHESASPLKEIQELRRDESGARAKQKPLPPGFYAYLGYLYYQMGNYDMATEAFSYEKNKFPESSVLMSRFLGKPVKR